MADPSHVHSTSANRVYTDETSPVHGTTYNTAKRSLLQLIFPIIYISDVLMYVNLVRKLFLRQIFTLANTLNENRTERVGTLLSDVKM
jgi:hypothetical protein